MPRYFFHLHGDDGRPDNVGAEIADMASVKRHAVMTFAAMIVGLDVHFWRREKWAMHVTDEAGLSVARFDLVTTATPAASHTTAG